VAPRPKFAAALLPLLLSPLLFCAKTPTILRDGVKMPVEEAARLDLQEGDAFFGGKRYKEASARYRRIVDQMPVSSLADNAMLHLARLLRTQDRLTDAARLLEALLSRYPQSDVLGAAKEELGRIYFARKNYPRAAEIFGALPWKEVPEPSRPSLERIVRATFDQVPGEKGKLFWLISVWDTLPEGTAREPLEAEIVSLLRRTETVEDLAEIFRRRDPRFPSDHASLLLARKAYESGSREEAREYLARFSQRFPNHPSSGEAAALSEALDHSDRIDPVSVGLLLPMTGPNQIYASQVLRGTALAVGLFGSARPDLPPVTFHVEDVGTNGEKAAEAVRRLTEESNVVAAMGPLSLKETQMAAAAAVPSALPILSLSPAEGITKIGDNVFRNSLTKSEQAAGLARLAVETLGIRRAAILYPQNNYGTEFMTFFWAEFQMRGGEIRGIEGYEPEANDFGAPIKRLVGLAQPELRSDEICPSEGANERTTPCYARDKLPPIVDFEAIFIPDGVEKVTQIAPALAFYNVRGVQILGSNLLNSADLFKARGGDSMQGTVFLDGFFRDKKSPPVPEFVQRFYTTFGSEPTVIEAQAFDTASILLDVIAKGRPSNRQAFSKALRSVRGFSGVSGEISFSADRDARRNLTPLIVEGEGIVELD
jgi:ABC-type branched-subunit amino acid transport system substrate-binding protein